MVWPVLPGQLPPDRARQLRRLVPGQGGLVDAGLSWMDDLRNGLDIYQYGFARTPTIYVDPSASASAGRGSYRHPYTTAAEIMARCAGNMAGQTLGFRRGTTLRHSSLIIAAMGAAGGMFTLCPYGDAQDLPIITGGAVITTWTLYDSARNIWAYTVGSTEHDVWQSDRRLLKVTWDTDAATTLAAAAGRSTYHSNVLYIKPYDGENPNLGQVEVSAADYAMLLAYPDVATSGYIAVCGLDIRKARNHALSVAAAGNGTITAASTIQVVGNRLSGAGVDNGANLGRDGISIYGPSDSVRLSGVYVAGNYVEDCLNNACELGGTTGAVVEFNKAQSLGGNGVVELWASNDTASARYNWCDTMSTNGRVNTNLSAGGVWFANYYYDGASWGNSTDSGNTKNHDNQAYFNIIIRPRNRGMKASGGTGHAFRHNTVIVDPDTTDPGDTNASMGWVTEGTATNGFLDISNNLFFWTPGTAPHRYAQMARIDNTLGSAKSIPTGDYNVYFTWWGAGDGGFRYNAATQASFTDYKSAVSSYSLDQHSLASTKYTGGTLTLTSLGFDAVSMTPLAAAASVASGLSTVGTMYQDGVPYDPSASVTIGALAGA